MLNLSRSKILKFLLFFTVVLQSGHAFQTIFNMVSYNLYLGAVIAMMIILILQDWANLSKPENIMFWTLMLMLSCTVIIYMGSGLSSYINIFCRITIAYCIIQLYSFDDVARCYLKVTTVVSIIALVGYILVNTTSVIEFLPSFFNYNGVEYKVGVIYNYIAATPKRNCAMFWEPGLFATNLTIAIIFELMMKKKASKFRLILFSICMFTANSSAGFVLWFLCLVLFFIRNEDNFDKTIKVIFSMVLLILVGITIFNFDKILTITMLGDNEYFQKLYSDSIFNSSRINAISHNMKMFIGNPIFGAGITNVTNDIAYVADTSTSTFLMSVFGILGISYTVFIIYGILKIKNISLLPKLLLLVIALIIVNKEPHQKILFTWIIMFYLVKGFDMVKGFDINGKYERKSDRTF